MKTCICTKAVPPRPALPAVAQFFSLAGMPRVQASAPVYMRVSEYEVSRDISSEDFARFKASRGIAIYAVDLASGQLVGLVKSTLNDWVPLKAPEVPMVFTVDE